MTDQLVSKGIASRIDYRDTGCWLWRGATKARYGNEPMYFGPNGAGKNVSIRVRQWLYQDYLHLQGKPYGKSQVWDMHALCGVAYCVNPGHMKIDRKFPDWQSFAASRSDANAA